MTDPLTLISTRRTPQNEPDPLARDRQVKNAAGGYAFQTSDVTKIRRFLVLGTTGGTYYTGERELTRGAAEVVLAAARDRGVWLANIATSVSVDGRAPKQNPAIFALAAVAGLGDDEARRFALAQLPLVCRTGTTLFQFVTYVEQFRGWGRGLRRAVAEGWYALPDAEKVAYQMVKYRQRNGWSHRDTLRLSHPRATDPARRALFNWAINGDAVTSRAAGWDAPLRPVGATDDDLPALVKAFEDAQVAGPTKVVELIAEHPLSWEMLPDSLLAEPIVWKALIRKGMPQTALLRQLPRLTRLDVLDDAEIRERVTTQLQDPEQLRKGRVHPINVLVAARTYASGRSDRGDSRWTPNRHVIDALDAAFYSAFAVVEPTNKRTLIALDVSDSMTWDRISGMAITPREASAALALVTLAREPLADVIGFTGGRYRGQWYGDQEGIRELSISPRQRLDDAIGAVSRLNAGPTDCALPYLWATEKGRNYDTVVIFTDNESWVGDIHPHQALRQYREKVGHDVRQVVVAMTATDYSVADPNDPLSLDVAGFDSAVPNLIADFSRGAV